MFDWFKKNKDSGNVINFPVPEVVPPMPEVKKPTTVFYRLGVTDNNRLSMLIGYSEITMSKAGVENLINQLQVFRDQLHDEDPENS